MSTRRVTSLLLGVALATTGVYLLVYLFRWQWNRALISGVLFVATEVLVVGRVILQRLRTLDQRLDELTTSERTRVRLVANRVEARDRFAWLRDATTRTNVFLPVLLGAGVLASAAAWAVETVARRTARPALERSLAGSLTTLSFPVAGFVGPEPARPRTRATLPLGWRRGALIMAGAAVAGTVAAGIDLVADATQTRPDRLDRGATTIIDLRFRGERALGDPTRHAADLVQFCASQTFLREIPALAVVDLAPAGARVVLGADLGERGTIRFRGCLEDTTLDRIQASVESVSELPPMP